MNSKLLTAEDQARVILDALGPDGFAYSMAAAMTKQNVREALGGDIFDNAVSMAIFTFLDACNMRQVYDEEAAKLTSRIDPAKVAELSKLIAGIVSLHRDTADQIEAALATITATSTKV